jgi:hypothetical protein
MSKALDWPRKNEAKVGGLDDASVASTYSRVSVMRGGKLDAEEEIRAKSMASALDLHRNKNVSVADLDDVSVALFMTLVATKMSSAQSRAGQDKGQAPGWLRRNHRSDDHSLSSVSKNSKRSHARSEAEIWAKSMSSALDWLRNNNADKVATDDPTVASCSIAGAGVLAFVQRKIWPMPWPGYGRTKALWRISTINQ